MKAHQPDYFLLIVVGVLLVLGLLTLFSASSIKGEFQFSDPLYFIRRQILYGILPGIFLFYLGYRIDHRLWRKFSFLILIVSLLLLFLLFVPELGLSLKGATRWLKLGPIVLQPSEFFKLGFIIYLASFFASHQGKADRFFEVVLPFLIILSFVGFLFLAQPAAGTVGVIAFTGVGMYILGGGRLKEIGILGVAVVLAFGYVVYSAPYRMERVVTLLNPTQDTQGSAYQLNQALISIGSGGISGVGIGHSRQKYNFLPETMTDSIFAIFAEETGFVGSLFLVFLLLFFLFRGFVIARASRENFSRFLAGGIAIWIVSQSLLNIAANLGLMPLTGIPLPFFSYGGSGMNAVLAACGILLNISRYTA